MNAVPADVTVILVNYNTRDLLRRCVDALRAGSPGLELQVIIVDNASRDGSAALLVADFGDCEVVINEVNVGFGRANNQVLDRIRGRYVLLLNTDAFVAPGGVAETVRFLESHPDCGLLGVRLVDGTGALQPSCRYFPTPWNEFLTQTGLARLFPKTRLIDDMQWDHAQPRTCDWVPGCYYLVRKTVLDQVGLFDPRYFLYYEEIDHCRAVKAAGWKVVYYPYTTVVHIGGESARSDARVTTAGRQISALQIESGLLYHRKHHGRLGLLSALALHSVGDLIVAVKWLLKRRSVRGLTPVWEHLATMWSLLPRTRWAQQPTR